VNLCFITTHMALNNRILQVTLAHIIIKRKIVHRTLSRLGTSLRTALISSCNFSLITFFFRFEPAFVFFFVIFFFTGSGSATSMSTSDSSSPLLHSLDSLSDSESLWACGVARISGALDLRACFFVASWDWASSVIAMMSINAYN